MISPNALKKKVLAKYPEVLKAYLTAEPFFPWTMRVNLSLTQLNPLEASKAIHALREGAKEKGGLGYQIQWKQSNSRRFGKNVVPAKLYFETAEDLAGYLNKTKEYVCFKEASGLVLNELPPLRDWLIEHVSQFDKHVKASVVDLVHICTYLQTHPQPNCYIRELRIRVETKFLEKHMTVLQEWLNQVLPTSSIRTHESDFYLRFGLRRLRNHFLIRLLDHRLCAQVGVPFKEFSLPLESISQLQLEKSIVLIVENKTNLLTLPEMPKALALGGIGNAVVQFKHIQWMHQCRIVYWGDMDVEGFEILSRLRTYFPQTETVFMDESTFQAHEAVVTKGNDKPLKALPNLVCEEQKMYAYCQKNRIRFEQEKIAQDYVLRHLCNRLNKGVC